MGYSLGARGIGVVKNIAIILLVGLLIVGGFYMDHILATQSRYEARLAAANDEIVQLTELAEANKFYFYYIRPREQQFGIDKLDSFLSDKQWLQYYERGAFDCSHMSAYLEYKLENVGFNTLIVLGPTPWDPETSHAWLLVETSPGEYMPVEATYPSIVWWGDPYFDNYYTYDHIFETIQEALDYWYEEFRWW